jgi:hypothetical protein
MADEKPEAQEPIPPPPESSDLAGAWNDLREAIDIPKLSDEKLREFVDDFVSNRIFTSAHLHENEAATMLSMVFMPIALGCFSKVQEESFKNVGVIWEYYSKAGPRSINGRPIFFSLNVLHIDDWERAKKAINREIERRQNIEL